MSRTANLVTIRERHRLYTALAYFALPIVYFSLPTLLFSSKHMLRLDYLLGDDVYYLQGVAATSWDRDLTKRFPRFPRDDSS